jgi:hypothetical protein
MIRPTPMNVNLTPLRLVIAIITALLALAACTESVSEQEQIANRQTIIAGTPSPTPTLTPTETPLPTNTPTSTVGPSPTATITPSPTVTPPPPTPTANPALTGFSLCEQVAGGQGRFSARLTGAATTGFPAYEQLTLTFEQPAGAAPLNASARCVNERDYLDLTGEATAPGPFVLQVDLAEWLRDADLELYKYVDHQRREFSCRTECICRGDDCDRVEGGVALSFTHRARTPAADN